MRFTRQVGGMVSDLKKGEIELTVIHVRYTADSRGKTLSLADEKRQIQLTVPFDEILKEINKE